MLHHLIMGEMGARGGATARIANHRGEVTDDQDGLVTEFLKLAELGEPNRVPQMNVGRGGINPELHLEGTAQRQLGGQLLLTQDLGTAGDKLGKLIGKAAHDVRRINRIVPLAANLWEHRSEASRGAPDY